MLEIAIVSTKCALRDEFPEFMEFWNERSWEAKAEPVETSEEANTPIEEATLEVETASETSGAEESAE